MSKFLGARLILSLVFATLFVLILPNLILGAAGYWAKCDLSSLCQEDPSDDWVSAGGSLWYCHNTWVWNIYSDCVLPVTSALANGVALVETKWYPTDVTITLSCVDRPGCQITYCKDADGTCTNMVAYDGTIPTYTATGYITFQSQDSAENRETLQRKKVQIDKTCAITSATIARSASCASSPSSCSASGTACKPGNSIDVEVKYKGAACPANPSFQIDASSGDGCTITASGGTINKAGISISCALQPSYDEQTCTGTWSLPSIISAVCQQKTISAATACIYPGGIGCAAGAGAFTTCKDSTPPVTSIALSKNALGFSASRTATATVSGYDATYSLSSCTLKFFDGPATGSPVKTVTKTCPAGAGVNCNSEFAAADKEYAYGSDGYKTATFECTNTNSVPGLASDGVGIDTTKPSSAVNALAARTKPTAGAFSVGWTGSDTMSDVKNYRLEYKDGATGVWTTCVSQLSPISVSFGPGCAIPITLQDGHTYYFRSMAEDNVGNFEDAPTSPDYDAFTMVDTSAPGGFDVRAEKEYLQWTASPFRVYTPTAIAADDIASCEYTTDGTTWNAAVWNSGTKMCEKTGLTCSDGQTLTLNIRVTDSVSNVGYGLSINRICDRSVPTIDTIVPAFGTKIYVGSLNPPFTIYTTDGKSGTAVAEWELFVKGKSETSYTSKGVSQRPCEGLPGAQVSCVFAPSNLIVGGNPYILSGMDTAYVKVKVSDHLDNWSPVSQSGEIVANPNAPTMSAIYPNYMKLGQAQKYKSDVTPKEELKVTSCELYVNNVLKGIMTQISGNMITGAGAWESTSQTLVSAGIYFMRARCYDNAGNIGDGPETLISVGTSTSSVIKPASSEKYEIININATYKDNADNPNAITGAVCSIADTDFIGPRTIKGKIFREIGDGIYTLSFEAPGKSGNYYYEVSCSKFGYQTTSDRKSFSVLGCIGPVCIDVTPPESLMIFTVGETQSIDLMLRNRGDDSRTYSVSVFGNTINIYTQIAPTQVAIAAGQSVVARITMTAVAFTAEQMQQNIAVTNVNDAADTDNSLIRVSVALSSLPDASMLAILFMASLASVALFFRKR